MRKPYAMLGVVFAALAVSSTPGNSQPASQVPAREGPSLILGAKIPLSGVSGRIDHFTFDPKRRLTIFSGLGNNTVGIVNNFEGKHVKTIKGQDEPQGPLYVPAFDKLFGANAGNGVVNVYDAKTWNLRKSISLGKDSDTDNVRYDEASKRVFVGVVGGIAMIDAATEAHVGDLKGSGGHTESFQLEKNGSRVFANVPGDGSVVNVIDRKTGALTKWDLNGAKANFPLILDEDNHRLFVITRAPPLVVVLNTDTGKEVCKSPREGSKRRRLFRRGPQAHLRPMWRGLYQRDPTERPRPLRADRKYPDNYGGTDRRPAWGELVCSGAIRSDRGD
jgi:hypothetical protein